MSRIGEIQTPLPATQTVLIGLLAAIVVTGRTLWNIVNHAETVVHEGAHALVGIATGRRIRSVTIDKNGGGSTDMVPKSGAGYGVAAFVGYIGSSAAGLIAAKLISIGHIVTVLFLGLLLCVVMLLLVRNFFGGTVILICGVLLYLVLRYTTAGVETAVAYGVTWFLLISGTKVALGAARRPKDVTDAEVLAGMTFLFRSAWCFLWLIGTIAALVVGGAILTHALCGIRLGLLRCACRCRVGQLGAAADRGDQSCGPRHACAACSLPGCRVGTTQMGWWSVGVCVRLRSPSGPL